MSLSIEGTRRAMLVAEAPLLRGVEGLPQALTQMDASERIKLDQEQAHYDTQERELREKHTNKMRLSAFGATFGLVGSGIAGNSWAKSIYEGSARKSQALGMATILCLGIMAIGANSFKKRGLECCETVGKVSNEILEARIGRLQSKIRFLEETLRGDLQQLEREQINRGKDYLSLHLSEIMAEKLNHIDVSVYHV